MSLRCWLITVVLLGLGWGQPWTIEAAGSPPSSRFTIDVWETEHGLPQNSIIAMTQTRDGYLWLGTLNGLVRFDGIRFRVFDESTTPGLVGAVVFLHEDRQRRLWIGTETAGLLMLQGGQFTSPAGFGSSSRERRFVAAADDVTGAVWLQQANGELWRFAEDRFTPHLLGAGEPSRVRSLITETNGTLWIATDRRQCAIDLKILGTSLPLPVAQELATRQLDFLMASRNGGYWRLADGRVQRWKDGILQHDWGPYPWGSTRVGTACEDREGRLLVGTLGAGVHTLEPNGGSSCLSTNAGLSHNYVLSLLVDQEGTLWVGTDGGGLNRVKPQVFEVLAASRGMVVQSVATDADGAVWLGSNGQGAARWDASRLTTFGAADGLVNEFVRAILVDREQHVWAGTWGAGLFLREGNRFAQPPELAGVLPLVTALHEDRHGRLWVGTQDHGLAIREAGRWRLYTTGNGLSSDSIRALADAPNGDWWVGTSRDGLNRIREGKVTVLRKRDTGMPMDEVSALWIDDQGVVWVGTPSNGLLRWDGTRWTRFTTKDGLASHSISYLFEDELGQIWVGSNQGLMRIRKQSLTDFAEGRDAFVPVRVFGRAEGLPTRECTRGSQPAVARDSDGRLWFSTIKGLVRVNPADIRPNLHPPPVVIEALWVDGESMQGGGARGVPSLEAILKPGHERIEIHYTGLNLSSAEQSRFRYRMEGLETEWTDVGSARVARYPRLAPGPYRFRVSACNEDGVWNEQGAAISLVVEMPVWRKGWFIALSLCLCLGTVAGAVHYASTQKLRRQVERLRHQEALEKERSRIARDLHDQLGASLTQVALLGELVESDKDMPNEVETHARQICQTARLTTHVLDEIVWAVNPSNDTLEGLVTYICKHAQDYLAMAGLRYRLDVPSSLPAATIAPDVRHNTFLAAKEAITNVVRHAQATSAMIHLNCEPTRFTVEISDDGRGPGDVTGPAASSRNGLKNMRKRMEDVGGQFEIAPGLERGTVVRLSAPFQPSA